MLIICIFYSPETGNRPLEALDKADVAAGVYYPVPLHLQKCYTDLGYQLGDLPNAEYLSHRTFAIPMFPEINDNEIEHVIEVLVKE